ncbi:hypothetical protein ABPG75_012322 [Micractinium tetrahymenae]
MAGAAAVNILSVRALAAGEGGMSGGSTGARVGTPRFQDCSRASVSAENLGIAGMPGGEGGTTASRDGPSPVPSDAAAGRGTVAAPAIRCAGPGCSATQRLRRCGGCRAVRYCSERCRDAAWPAHRHECHLRQA